MSSDSSSNVGHGQSMLQREITPIGEGSSVETLYSLYAGVSLLEPFPSTLCSGFFKGYFWDFKEEEEEIGG